MPSSVRRRARPWRVHDSPIHGRGVFAARAIRKGETIIEYRGRRTSWEDASAAAADDDDPYHTFLFSLDDGRVIDAGVRGNAARWINHSCAPNCEADETGGRVFIRTLRAIEPGEELFYDYGLTIDERYTPALKKQYECRCGARGCRRTMLAPKR